MAGRHLLACDIGGRDGGRFEEGNGGGVHVDAACLFLCANAVGGPRRRVGGGGGARARRCGGGC
jgi:hypothetical protein